ncbi:N-acetylneuraminate synthase family protein [Sneathiella chinensis]|uniref:N-acetylneuraminate synthase n=1 Tax=Sneathiella chinensis TaxID=349750 RepID=A0ABQ5U1P6_9PROT|nr:N-acetylneuraminate synthase family protein [Sneathiella chinensis]GLQ05753.1 N-acetylneuraminate synthase [Sneathiella chinensis]
MSEVQVIAEIGCNHKGDMEIAKELIRVAAVTCGAHVAKFQKRHNRELLTAEEYDRAHPVPANAYGDTYGEHREFLELSVEQHRELQAECDKYGIIYSTSVWDVTSAREIASLNPKLIKIPSATNLHFELQEYLCKHYDGEIHVSTGMTTKEEIDRIVEFYEQHGRAKDLVLYACTSGYPVEFKDVCLLEINALQKRYGNRVKMIGFSGHHLGIATDVAAMTAGVLGEQLYGGTFGYIERHFTLDRTWKGTDHSASLEPDGLRRLCRDVKNVRQTLQAKSEDVLDVEKVQRDKLKWQPRDGEVVALEGATA